MTIALRNIHGSGGDDGGGTEYPNTARSTNRARLVEVISEGPTEGLVGGAKAIFFDQTPLMNQTGTLNFKGVTFEERFGLPDQAALTGNATAETPFQVNVRVRKDQGPVIRTVNELNATSLRAIVRIPAMAVADDKGNIFPRIVKFQWHRRSNGGAWQLVHDITLQEKFTSPVQFPYRIDLPEGGAPWDIMMTRVTEDSLTTKIQDETWFDSYSTSVEGRFIYPNTALVFLNINASYFNSTALPSRAFLYKGLLIHVPTNYDPIARTYTGMWDGTFKVAWSNSPPWILYDLLINDRYGLGEFIDAAKIDKWSLYKIAQYCDESVPDGYGGTEPRYTYNGQINTREEAFKVIQTIST